MAQSSSHEDTYGDDEFEPTVRLWQAAPRVADVYNENEPPLQSAPACADISGHGPTGPTTLYLLGRNHYCVACVLELAGRYVDLND